MSSGVRRIVPMTLGWEDLPKSVSVEGASSFDALIQFSPFHFTVSISTSFSAHVFLSRRQLSAPAVPLH